MKCRKSVDEVSNKSRRSVEKSRRSVEKCRKVSKSVKSVKKASRKRQKSVNSASNCARPNFSNRDFWVNFQAFFEITLLAQSNIITLMMGHPQRVQMFLEHLLRLVLAFKLLFFFSEIALKVEQE